MKKEILRIIKHANFSRELIEFVKSSFPMDYTMRFNQPYAMSYLENPLMELEAQERALESLAQLIPLQEYYLNKGIPLRYLYESIYDLNYRLNRYRNEQGTFGLSERDIRWLGPLYNAEIFDLGSLRYQISGFSYQEIERSDYDAMPLGPKWKERFPEGTPIITIHILKDTNFKPQKVDESFLLARDFFQKYYKEHDFEVFVCRTWLLYGPTRDILKDGSNIASFSKRFEIIANNQNTKQALDRIYGTSNLDEIQTMDKPSSLAKVAYKNLDKLGVAAGIIYK